MAVQGGLVVSNLNQILLLLISSSNQLSLWNWVDTVSDTIYLNSCLTHGRVKEWDAMSSVNSKDASRPCLSHHQRDWWNEINELSVEKWWNKICGMGKLEKPREKPIQAPFLPPWNPHGVTKMRTQDPSGGRWASNCLHYGKYCNI